MWKGRRPASSLRWTCTASLRRSSQPERPARTDRARVPFGQPRRSALLPAGSRSLVVLHASPVARPARAGVYRTGRRESTNCTNCTKGGCGRLWVPASGGLSGIGQYLRSSTRREDPKGHLRASRCDLGTAGAACRSGRPSDRHFTLSATGPEGRQIIARGEGVPTGRPEPRVAAHPLTPSPLVRGGGRGRGAPDRGLRSPSRQSGSPAGPRLCSLVPSGPDWARPRYETTPIARDRPGTANAVDSRPHPWTWPLLSR